MKISTGKCRINFPCLFTPREDLSGREMFDCVLFFDRNSQTAKRLRDAYDALKDDPENKKIFASGNVEYPVKDGDEVADRYPEYAGKLYIKVKNSKKPVVLDADNVEIIDPSEIYSGCYVQAVLSAFCYNKAGHRGVSFWLQGIKKIADGEPIGGSRVTAADFDDEILD